MQSPFTKCRDNSNELDCHSYFSVQRAPESPQKGFHSIAVSISYVPPTSLPLALIVVEYNFSPLNTNIPSGTNAKLLAPPSARIFQAALRHYSKHVHRLHNLHIHRPYYHNEYRPECPHYYRRTSAYSSNTSHHNVKRINRGRFHRIQPRCHRACVSDIRLQRIWSKFKPIRLLEAICYHLHKSRGGREAVDLIWD
jgi:hypothetical protein